MLLIFFSFSLFFGVYGEALVLIVGEADALLDELPPLPWLETVFSPLCGGC